MEDIDLCEQWASEYVSLYKQLGYDYLLEVAAQWISAANRMIRQVSKN